MTAIAHVLAPLDGTPAAEAALRWLHFLPLQRLTLLHVCEQPPNAAAAAAYLSTITERLRTKDCATESLVRIGCPADAIVEAAQGTDLVVMATGAHGGGGRLLFGSVADRVARHSPAPTLLLRHGTVPEEPTGVRRLVAPLDGSSAAERALSPAVALARALDCPIHLISVDEADGGPPAETQAATESYLRQRALALQDIGVPISTERRTGDPSTSLLAAVVAGDLLMLTTHGRGAARRWQIGSVAEKLLRQATAPVVLVRADTP